MTFTLPFAVHEILHWANRYPERELIKDRQAEEIGQRAKQMGYLTRPDFIALAYWKSPRSKHHSENNAGAYVEEVTRIALSTPNERLRIEILRLLEGVGWPTASAILHLAHVDPYPIIDFRAFWTLGLVTKKADFGLWDAYTRYCRKLAEDAGVSMRTVDRALWTYSKDNQRA